MIAAWKGKPPQIKFTAEPMPGTPYVRLLGCGVTDMSLENFVQKLATDKETGNGHGHTFPVKGRDCEEDTYILEGWEVYTSPDSCYEALIVLYYSALYPYQVIKKYMGEDMAEEYRLKQLATLN